MTRPFWRAISALPDCWIGSLGLSAGSTPLVPRRPIPVADGSTYLPRKHAERPPEEVALEFDAPPDRAVLLANVLGGYELFEIRSAQAGTRAMRPVAENDLSALYAPPAGGTAPVRWRISVRTTRVEGVEAIAVAPRSGPARIAERCLAP